MTGENPITRARLSTAVRLLAAFMVAVGRADAEQVLGRHHRASSNNRSTVFRTSSRVDDATVVFRSRESSCKVNVALYIYDPPGV